MQVYLDIESVPGQGECRDLIAASITPPTTMSKPETIEMWHKGQGKYEGVKEAAIEEKWRKTALDGTQGELISVAYAIGSEQPLVKYRDLGESEAMMLRKVFLDIEMLCAGRPPRFVGHFIQFDLQFLYRRAVILGVKPAFNLPFRGRHEKDYFCTMEEWCGYKDRISQDNLCKALGIEGKPNDIDGSKVWDYVKEGGIERVAIYNVDDVEKVRQIYNRLMFN